MHKLHQEILTTIRDQAEKNEKKVETGSRYAGHQDLNYPLSRPEERMMAKNFLKKHPELNLANFITLLDSLYQGKSTNKKSIAGLLLENAPQFRKKINPMKIDQWLNNLYGWCQIDCLCQANFSAEELLANWPKWQRLIRSLNKNQNINKRRASLVLLTKSVRGSQEKKLADLALEMIDNLKDEKEILITKAVSWLLREMIKNHRHRVEEYLAKNEGLLPAIAVREVKNKLKTGKK
jgi:3-methyladenine DNA glycosylase AlkD